MRKEEIGHELCNYAFWKGSTLKLKEEVLKELACNISLIWEFWPQVHELISIFKFPPPGQTFSLNGNTKKLQAGNELSQFLVIMVSGHYTAFAKVTGRAWWTLS